MGAVWPVQWWIAVVAASTLLSLSSAGHPAREVELAPTFESIRGESYAIWQIPSRPVAVLLVAHGLHHGAGTFWDATPGCQICSPLPEERLVTKAALARGYAVVTVQGGSKDRGWNLETDLEINPDFLRVAEFLRPWRRDHGLESLPLLAFGLSRGGDFVSVLALGMRLSGIVLMVSGGVEAAVELAAVRSAAGLRIWPYPPTLFVHMPKDSVTEQEVQRQIASLSAKGLGTDEIKCYAFPVYESLFSDRIPGLDLNVSSTIFEALKAEGYLTPDGFLNQPDPVDWETYGEWDWNAVVQSLKQVKIPQANGTDSQVWIEAVAEELSLSYGFHSCSSLPSVQIMDWLDRTWRPGQRETLRMIWTTLVPADQIPSKLLSKHFNMGKNF